MDKMLFLKKLEEGARFAKRARFANAQLPAEETEKAFAELEAYAEECIGLFAAPADYIKDMFFWAADEIKF